MSENNAEQEWFTKVIGKEFNEVAKPPPSFLLEDRKKFIKRLITALRDIPHPVNEIYGMADILLLNPQVEYNGKVLKAEEYIDRYKEKSARVIGFAYNTDAAAAGNEMEINKGIVDLVLRLLPYNLWQTHLVEATGDKKIPQGSENPWHHPVDPHRIDQTWVLGHKHRPPQA